MADSLTVDELLDGHVALDVECLDRIYLNGYVPNLQVGGQVASFMTQHLGYPIPSPAIMEKMGTSFRRAVRGFADTNHIPVVQFHKGERKIDVMGRYLTAQAANGRSGVAAIGVAQEYQNVFAATQRERSAGFPWFSFTQSIGADGRQSHSSSLREVPVMDPSRLRMLPFGTAVLMLRAARPIVLTMTSWTKRPDAAELRSSRRRLEEGIERASSQAHQSLVP
jgi:hypothetical protein